MLINDELERFELLYEDAIKSNLVNFEKEKKLIVRKNKLGCEIVNLDLNQKFQMICIAGLAQAIFDKNYYRIINHQIFILNSIEQLKLETLVTIKNIIKKEMIKSDLTKEICTSFAKQIQQVINAEERELAIVQKKEQKLYKKNEKQKKKRLKKNI